MIWMAMLNLSKRICGCADQASKRRSVAGFTLIELMIIVTLIGILAAIVFPVISSSSDQARAEALASNVAGVRSMLVFHSGKGDVALSGSGYPTTVESSWFPSSRMPEHAWSGAAMVVTVVNAAANVSLPAQKTFDPFAVGATSAWYNPDSGWFCALVPAFSSDALTLETFNQVNKTRATSLNQTTQ
jgi:type II secretory pathway pseudopilin PulG